MVSRIALVIVSPGTRSIIEPIIILSRFSPRLIFISSIAINAVIPPQREFMKNSFIFNFWHDKAIIFIIAPIIKAPQKSKKSPPNNKANEPAVIDDQIKFVISLYL